jgi:S1-C subfamily serine protease
MDTEHTSTEAPALDAYSRVVTDVATVLPPTVAALSVRAARGSGAGTAGIYLGDILVTAGGVATTSVQALQCLMLGPAIGTRLPVTVLRRDALVDVATIPTELT